MEERKADTVRESDTPQALEPARELQTALESAETRERLLGELLAEAAGQRALLQKQLGWTRLLAAAALGLLAVAVAAACVVLPRLSGLAGQAEQVAAQAGQVMSDLRTVSQGLADADPGGVLSDIDRLVGQTRRGLDDTLAQAQAALSTIQEVDIDTLNRSIADLNAVVAPLRRLLGG